MPVSDQSCFPSVCFKLDSKFLVQQNVNWYLQKPNKCVISKIDFLPSFVVICINKTKKERTNTSNKQTLHFMKYRF